MRAPPCLVTACQACCDVPPRPADWPAVVAPWLSLFSRRLHFFIVARRAVVCVAARGWPCVDVRPGHSPQASGGCDGEGCKHAGCKVQRTTFASGTQGLRSRQGWPEGPLPAQTTPSLSAPRVGTEGAQQVCPDPGRGGDLSACISCWSRRRPARGLTRGRRSGNGWPCSSFLSRSLQAIARGNRANPWLCSGKSFWHGGVQGVATTLDCLTLRSFQAPIQTCAVISSRQRVPSRSRCSSALRARRCPPPPKTRPACNR